MNIPIAPVFKEKRMIMLRRFLLLSVGSVALPAVLGAPSQVHAQRMRGGAPPAMRGGFRSGFNRGFNPGFNRGFDRRFDPRFNRRFDPRFDPRFNRPFSPAFRPGFFRPV